MIQSKKKRKDRRKSKLVLRKEETKEAMKRNIELEDKNE